MEKYILSKDITVFYVTATSFPAGIEEAYKKLHSFLPEGNQRTFYGISYSNRKGEVVYKAAVAESFPGEGEKNGCETFVIKKGEYISEILRDWKKDESSIGKTFQKLLHQPKIDPKGYCLEIYLNEKDVRCLVPLAESLHLKEHSVN
jgi:predicted transcriptional regulator YdeE